jgi:hypothetical protein
MQPESQTLKKNKSLNLTTQDKKTITNMGLIVKHTKFRHKALKGHDSIPFLLANPALLGSILQCRPFRNTTRISVTNNVLTALSWFAEVGEDPTEIILVDDKPFVTVGKQSARVYKFQNNFSKALTVNEIMTTAQL